MLRFRHVCVLSRFAAACLAVSLPVLSFVKAKAQEDKPDARYGSLAFRQIGPFRGGRVGAVTGVQTQPLVFCASSPTRRMPTRCTR